MYTDMYKKKTHYQRTIDIINNAFSAFAPGKLFIMNLVYVIFIENEFREIINGLKHHFRKNYE